MQERTPRGGRSTKYCQTPLQRRRRREARTETALRCLEVAAELDSYAAEMLAEQAKIQHCLQTQFEEEGNQ